jgi:hypothetical protein
LSVDQNRDAAKTGGGGWVGDVTDGERTPKQVRDEQQVTIQAPSWDMVYQLQKLLKGIVKEKKQSGNVPANVLDLVGLKPGQVDAVFAEKAAARSDRRTRTLQQIMGDIPTAPDGSMDLTSEQLASLGGT